ncbi:MAG: glycosyltransferase family 4 protein [Bacteroidetes bacterium]|nr:glycosyltransferase family 4 protein [Bacteroidota bacterium]
MSTKKYIYIVQVTRQLSIDILNDFVKQGAEVELVTGIIESNYERLDPRVNVRYFNKYNNTSGFKRLFTWSLFTLYSFFYVLFKSRKKELILVTTPPFIVFIGSFFKRIRKQKYHLIVWDLYPDVLINLGVFKESSLAMRIWKKKNISCFQKADTIFTLGEHLSEAIKKYSGKNSVIIQNWVNANFVKPVPKAENTFALQHNLQNKLVVMYSGNLGMTHDIESIVDTAEILKNNSDIHFVIIGDGAKKAAITQMVSDKKLSNVLLLPYQDKAVLPFSLSSADIGIVTLSDGAESISVPSKTYYTLAAGSALLALAANESELGLLIQKYKCGKVFAKAKAEEIATFILHLLNNKGELAELKQNSRLASFDFTPENAKNYYQYISRKSESHV